MSPCILLRYHRCGMNITLCLRHGERDRTAVGRVTQVQSCHAAGLEELKEVGSRHKSDAKATRAKGGGSGLGRCVSVLGLTRLGVARRERCSHPLCSLGQVPCCQQTGCPGELMALPWPRHKAVGQEESPTARCWESQPAAADVLWATCLPPLVGHVRCPETPRMMLDPMSGSSLP